MGLEQRTKFIAGIVTIKDRAYGDIKPFLNRWMDEESVEYAFILHSEDVLDDGTKKTPHIHFVATLKKPSRLSTTLHRISDALGVNPLAVTISKYSSFAGCVQYLIHKNNPEKYSYPMEDICSNIPKDELMSLMDDETGIDADRLISMVVSSPNRMTLIRSLGLSKYRVYRSIIADIENDIKGKKL